MRSDQLLVLALAVTAIAWVNWYFFFSESRASARVAATAANAGPAEVVITVDGGYQPRTVHVRAGEPVRLVFDRRDTGSCSEEVVFPDFGIRRFLPTGQRTVVEVTPAAGSHEFMCGMSMLHGTLVAE
jgi:plastocyanin domain-containing protein